MKQQHHDIDQKTYGVGINSDVNKEILGSEDGVHVDARNMRSLPMDGNNLAKKKIKGEELLYDAIDNKCFGGTGLPLSANYYCQDSIEIQNHIIEFWVDREALLDPFIRVDGKIVCQSPKLPLYYEYPIQTDKNENCNGGEFYVTNNFTSPMVFSLKDMMINGGLDYGSEPGVCSSKYFDDFDVNQYTVNISSSLYKPAFIKTVTGPSGGFTAVIGSTGIPVGTYSYSYRFVTTSGDRTNFSPITELVPVVRSLSASFPQFPGLRTFSSDPDISSPTSYGNHIRIRYENNLDFDFIEIRRDSWYNGDPIGTTPVSEIIGSVDVSSGIYVLDILDRCGSDEAQEIITLDEQTNQLTAINRAKTLRYFNERLYLMNVGYQSKDIDDDISFIDPDTPGFPVIEKIGKEGHKNTYHSTYHKSNMRGEKISTGVLLWDQSTNPSYVKELENNFQFPNRREVISADTNNVSYKGTVRASSVNNVVSNTHEVFDHVDAVSKADGYAEVEILDIIGSTGYNVLNPVGQNDTTSDLNKAVNHYVGEGRIFDNTFAYSPKGFGLNHYPIGYAFKGFDTTNNSLPNWASGFSVVQTDPARRVISQGMGFYWLEQPGGVFGPNGGKRTNAFYVYFPDMDEETGIFPANADDLLNNPSSYQLQLVSPLGYFTEVYSYFNAVIGRDEGVDMIMYNRVLKEDGSINPTSDTSNSGINGYTGYGKWRNPTNNSPFNSISGNSLFNIVSVDLETTPTGQGKYFKVTIDQSVYAEWGANGDTFEDQNGVKEWQEPMYVVNLVKNDASINQGLTQQYKYTGHFVKFNSNIYKVGVNGENEVHSVLVSERWEDCVPKLSVNTNPSIYDSYKRFVFVKDVNGNETRWLNVQYESNAFVNQVLTDITANGFAVVTDPSGSYNVYGVYKHTESTDSTARIVVLDFVWFNQGFSKDYMVPPASSIVVVKYDNRIPVRVFGGDTYINESVWAVKDFAYNKNNNPVSGEFSFELPLPYGSFYIPGSVKIVRNTQGINRIQDNSDGMRFTRGVGKGATIRQMLSMWTAETRTNLSFAFNDEAVKHSLLQFFPLKNYVYRPYQWDDSEFGDGDPSVIYPDNNIYPDYGNDYGNEFLNWGLGGFRFKPQVNIDYSKSQNTLLLTSVPSLGFDEQIDFCTRIVWSEKRPVNAQNTPTVRTFPPGNFYDISDDTGEIKRAFSAISGDKGNNLYAFTDSGVCLLLVDKRIIHEINANELATVGSDIGGILNELWIDRTIGMNDETWRSSAEYSNSIFWGNYNSAYLFGENQIQDIAITGFKSEYNRKFVPLLGTGYSKELTGGYNVFHQEYLMGFERLSGDPRTLVYGVQQKSLQCKSDYNYDQYLYIDNKLYGFKFGKTFELGIGDQIDGENMEASVTGVSDKEIYFDKEFIRIRVNSNVKPEQIDFYDSYENYLLNTPSATVDANAVPLSIKDYFGFECYIPRKDAPPYNRHQGRFLLFKIRNSTDENFLVTSTGVMYKKLK